MLRVHRWAPLALLATSVLAQPDGGQGQPQKTRLNTAGDLLDQIHGEGAGLHHEQRKLDEDELEAWRAQYEDEVRAIIRNSKKCKRDDAAYQECLCKALAGKRLPKPPRCKSGVTSYEVKFPLSTRAFLSFAIASDGKVGKCVPERREASP